MLDRTRGNAGRFDGLGGTEYLRISVKVERRGAVYRDLNLR